MNYNYKLIRSDRRTISMTITSDNIITVRCPKNISQSKLDEFLAAKKAWLDKIISANNLKMSKESGVINYREIYVGGNKLPLKFSDINLITHSAVYLRNLNCVKSTYISRFSREFIDEAQRLSLQLNLPAATFKVKYYKSKWGSCDNRKNISFNYLLFMLSPQIQRYVVIHELCHTVHFNHSDSFWRLVASFEPDYKILRKQLKSFSYLINLYK